MLVELVPSNRSGSGRLLRAAAGLLLPFGPFDGQRLDARHLLEVYGADADLVPGLLRRIDRILGLDDDRSSSQMVRLKDKVHVGIAGTGRRGETRRPGCGTGRWELRVAASALQRSGAVRRKMSRAFAIRKVVAAYRCRFEGLPRPPSHAGVVSSDTATDRRATSLSECQSLTPLRRIT